jgi:hypothetical protein
MHQETTQITKQRTTKNTPGMRNDDDACAFLKSNGEPNQTELEEDELTTKPYATQSRRRHMGAHITP